VDYIEFVRIVNILDNSSFLISMRTRHIEIMETKSIVAIRFLNFVSRYTAIDKAQLATLGGEGVEAAVWAKHGIRAENGWLIERNRGRKASLINGSAYRTHNQLGTFPQILAGYGKERVFIDGFHLDLCGNFSSETIANFAPVLPLVFASPARCLAVTVADQRRNTILETWTTVRKEGEALFGKTQVSTLLEHFSLEQKQVPKPKNLPAFMQPSDPEKAAKREFGLLVEIARLLKRHQSMRSTVERYLYVSRYGGRAFRMRTYFFHFEPTGRKTDSPTKLAMSWVLSQLFFGRDGKFEEVQIPESVTVANTKPTAEPLTKEKPMLVPLPVPQPQESKLRAVAEALGGAEKAEYDRLTSDSARLQKFLQVLNSNGETVMPVSQTPITTTSPSTPEKKKKKWQDFSERDQIVWLLNSLEQRAQNSDGRWQKADWQKLLKKDFGHYNASLGISLRAALARTSGKFRPNFEERIRRVMGGEAPTYLARLLSIL